MPEPMMVARLLKSTGEPYSVKVGCTVRGGPFGKVLAQASNSLGGYPTALPPSVILAAYYRTTFRALLGLVARHHGR
jgi:hypothetical protein